MLTNLLQMSLKIASKETVQKPVQNTVDFKENEIENEIISWSRPKYDAGIRKDLEFYEKSIQNKRYIPPWQKSDIYR